MQGPTKEQELKASFKIDNLPLEDKQKLVGAFVWLVQEDKKQNPELYQRKKTQND